MAITDNFTDTSGTNLESHVSPGGQTWTRSSSAPNGSLSLASNKIDTYGVVDGSAIYEWNVGAISTDVTFSIDYVMPLASPNEFFFSLTLRGGGSSGAGFTGYVGIVSRVGGVLTLAINRDGAGLVSLAVPSLDDGAVHTLTLTARGTQLALFVDGVRKLVTNDINYTAQGQSRINVRNTHAGTIPSGFYLDNASIDAASPQPLTVATTLAVTALSRRMVPIPPTVAAFLTARHRPIPGALSLGGTGGSAPPIEGQLWPRGQKSG